MGVRTWSDIERAANTQILDWAESQPWAREMAGCQQDAQWHAEGDVWTHTKMVCAEIERLTEWPSLDRVHLDTATGARTFLSAASRGNLARLDLFPSP